MNKCSFSTQIQFFGPSIGFIYLLLSCFIGVYVMVVANQVEPSGHLSCVSFINLSTVCFLVQASFSYYSLIARGKNNPKTIRITFLLPKTLISVGFEVFSSNFLSIWLDKEIISHFFTNGIRSRIKRAIFSCVFSCLVLSNNVSRNFLFVS